MIAQPLKVIPSKSDKYRVRLEIINLTYIFNLYAACLLKSYKVLFITVDHGGPLLVLFFQPGYSKIDNT